MAARRPAAPRAWQRMLSGRRLDLLNPSPLDVEITDIAHGLARVARWNGQTAGDHAFSVAQHSLLVETLHARLFPESSPEQRLAALLHDAPEYVIGDIISPFKAVVGGDYKSVEERLHGAILQRFGLRPADARLRGRIKRADRLAAYLEATALAGFSAPEAVRYFGHPPALPTADCEMSPQPARTVYEAFLARFAEIESLRPVQSRKSEP